MKNILSAFLLIMTVGNAFAASCPSGWKEQNDAGYKLVGDGESCGGGWQEVADSAIRPIMPAGSDSIGSYSEVVCQ